MRSHRLTVTWSASSNAHCDLVCVLEAGRLGAAAGRGAESRATVDTWWRSSHYFYYGALRPAEGAVLEQGDLRPAQRGVTV